MFIYLVDVFAAPVWTQMSTSIDILVPARSGHIFRKRRAVCQRKLREQPDVGLLDRLVFGGDVAANAATRPAPEPFRGLGLLRWLRSGASWTWREASMSGHLLLPGGNSSHFLASCL